MQHSNARSEHAAQFTSEWTTFSANPWPDECARPDSSCDGLSDDRSPRTGVQRAGQESAAQRSSNFPDKTTGCRLSRIWNRSLGSSPREHAVSWRHGADVGNWPLRFLVEEDGGQACDQIRIHG